MTEAIMWEVSAEEVRALASQHAPKTAPDPVYQRDLRAISNSDVESWINEVSAMVDLRLRRRERLTKANLTRFVAAAKTVVKVGAAAYLVDAAAPARAGVGDNSSYGHVLWTRYQDGLEELAEQLEEWINDGGTEDEDAGPAGGGAGCFQTPIFRDDLKW